MWDPPPTGYNLIDLTGQTPTDGRKQNDARRPLPPSAPNHTDSSPAGDKRKMRNLRPSDSGLTAVLAIRQHAAVLELKEARHHDRRRRGGVADSPRGDGPPEHTGTTVPSITRNESLAALENPWEKEGGTIDLHDAHSGNIPEGEGHATMADR